MVIMKKTGEYTKSGYRKFKKDTKRDLETARKRTVEAEYADRKQTKKAEKIASKNEKISERRSLSEEEKINKNAKSILQTSFEKTTKKPLKNMSR